MTKTVYVCGTCFVQDRQNSEFSTKEEYDLHKNFTCKAIKKVTSSQEITARHAIQDTLRNLRREYIISEKSIIDALINVLVETSTED